MARVRRPRVTAIVAVPVLASALVVGTAGIASAATQTVSVPGTPATAPCTVSVSEQFALGSAPGFSESGTCKL